MSETEANQPTAVGGDHLLIVVWIAGEDGGSSTVESLHEGFSDADLTIELLKNSGFLEDGDAGSVSLTDEGRILTESLVRRHRLAEVLLEEVIGVPPSAAASQACDVEHFLRPDVIEHICTFLGHPRNCPHGRPIPLGLCCTSSDHSVEPLVQQLSSVNPGATVRIIFIRPQTHARLDRLAAMGVVPGTTIHLHQKKPAFVILFGETELAIEARVADDIYVRRTYGDT